MHRTHRLLPQIVLAAALAFAAHPGHAEPGQMLNGPATPGQPNRASANGFGVLQIATDRPDELIAAWAKTTPGVALPVSTKAARNKPIVTFVIFQGCRPDAAGNCNLTADYVLTDPSGKTEMETKSVPIWMGHPPPPSNEMALAPAGYGITFVDTDALGDHHLAIAVTDQVSGTVLHTEQALTVVAN